MSVHEYNVARNKALKTMTMGLVFLIFLPIGIPMSLLVVPFLAGRNGARDLPSNWHLTYILTVGGGWSVGLVITLISLLSKQYDASNDIKSESNYGIASKTTKSEPEDYAKV